MEFRSLSAQPDGASVHVKRAAIALLSFAGILACETSRERLPGESDGAGGSSTSTPLFGAISVEILESTETREAMTVARGRVYDRQPTPAAPLVVVEEIGACQLLAIDLPTCDEACPSGNFCAPGNVCQPYPRAQDVGDLVVRGLDVGEALLESVQPSFDYQSEPLPSPPCTAGHPVELEGLQFSARAQCIEPLVVPSDEPIVVRRGQDVELSWEAPDDDELARIHVRLDVSHHGGKTGEIFCDVHDTGAFAIPAELVTGLVDQGLAGFPSIFLTRVNSTPAQGAPDVTFQVISPVERPVDTGVTSCLEDVDCGDDEVCDRTTLICVER